MKKMKRNILICTFAILIGLTSCFDEKEEDYQIVGGVATVSVFSIPKATPYAVNAGEKTLVSTRYYSERVAVRQLRFFETIGTGTRTLIGTRDITDFDIKNSYEESLDYTVPAVPSKTKVTLTVEVETENDLMNSRSLTMTIN
jgi:hypothetical protein